MQSYRTGAAMVLAAGLLWSLMGPVIRLVDAANTWQILFYRSLGMIPVLTLFIALRPGRSPGARLLTFDWTAAAGGLALVAAMAGAIYAIQSTTIANAVFLFSASPFLAAVLGRLILGERVRPATWAAIALALAGVALMVREGLAAGAGWGNLAALLSSLGFAAFTVTLRHGRRDNQMQATLLGAVFAVVVAALVVGVAGSGLAVSLRDALLSAAMGAGLLAAGLILYTLGSRTIPAAETTLLSLVEVMLAPVWAWWLLGEGASVGTFAGGAIVLVAVGFNALSGARVETA